MEHIIDKSVLIPISDELFEIPQSYRQDMRVPARVYMNKAMFEDIADDKSLWQLVNVSTLPGIQKYALAMPDIHQGYGFPIGGVAATAIDEGGVISPGGIGYDINCGVRVLVANMDYDSLKPHMDKLATELYNVIPSGVGRGGNVKLSRQEIDNVLNNGVSEIIKMGYGNEHDMMHCENAGYMSFANAAKISDHAKKRGHDQVGTLGSGNHFLEIQRVCDVYDDEIAQLFNIQKNSVVVMIHCGSRGLGHQTCTDYVKQMVPKIKELNIVLPDRELACVPFLSEIGQDYFAAMAAAANFAWANRHMIGHWVREAWQRILGSDATLTTLYDVSHNLGKQEVHVVDGIEKFLLVHRKGATRSFGPNHPDTPQTYRHVGQPVFIPGSMGTFSHILVGTQKGMEQSFGSCCHGAGRRLSRTKAKKMIGSRQLRDQLEAKGILIRCESDRGLTEEAPLAYKDVDNVVQVVHNAGLAKKVARTQPLAVIKGS